MMVGSNRSTNFSSISTIAATRSKLDSKVMSPPHGVLNLLLPRNVNRMGDPYASIDAKIKKTSLAYFF